MEQFTRKEAAMRLKISEQTLDRWIKRGYLQVSYFGPRMIRISLREIERIECGYITNRTPAASLTPKPFTIDFQNPEGFVPKEEPEIEIPFKE